MERHPLQGSVVPFARRWHVVHEIDLIRLIAGHRYRLTLCDRAEAIADDLPQLPSPTATAAFVAALGALALRDGDDADAFLAAMR